MCLLLFLLHNKLQMLFNSIPEIKPKLDCYHKCKHYLEHDINCFTLYHMQLKHTTMCKSSKQIMFSMHALWLYVPYEIPGKKQMPKNSTSAKGFTSQNITQSLMINHHQKRASCYICYKHRCEIFVIFMMWHNKTSDISPWLISKGININWNDWKIR